MTILIPFQLLVNILLLNGARLSVPSHTLPWLGVNAVAIGLYMVSGIIVYLYLDIRKHTIVQAMLLYIFGKLWIFLYKRMRKTQNL